MPVMQSPSKKQNIMEENVEQNVSTRAEADFLGFDSANTSTTVVDRNQRIREHFGRKLARIEHSVTASSQIDFAFLKGCSTRIAHLATEYEKWHMNSFGSVSAEQFERDEEDYADFDRRQFELATKIERMMIPKADIPSVQPRIKLPEMRIPSFDGTFDSWMPFRDSFVSIIDTNPSLSDVDKLHFLKGAVIKDAQRVIGDIEITAANYTVAWELLNARYNNRKLVVKKYIDGLLSIPPMKRESYEELIGLIDGFERSVQMTKKMGVTTDGWDVLLAHMLCSRLDPSTQKQWETFHRSSEVATYEELLKFLRSHATVLQAMTSQSRSMELSSTTGKSKAKNSQVYSVQIEPGTPCVFCKKQAHSPFGCDVFRKASVPRRYELVKENNLCFNCLAATHQRNRCTSGACRVCRRKHHTMLHQTNPSTESSPHQPRAIEVPVLTNEAVTPSSVVQHCAQATAEKIILLPTAMVKVMTTDGNILWARALLDGGSQINIATERLVQRLRVSRAPDHHNLGGIGKARHVSTHSVQLNVHSHCSNFSTNWKFHVLSDVTWDQPSHVVDASTVQVPEGIILADAKYHQPGPIDLLIGREAYNEVMLEGIIRLDGSTLMLQRTELGWIVSGKASRHEPPTSFLLNVMTLEEQVSRFWELESCNSPNLLSVEESECEAEFESSTTRNAEGRFVVALPKKQEQLRKLGSSYEIALRRFHALDRRLKANPAIQCEYSKFLREYRELHHMDEIITETDTETTTYYMPHHCVIKPESLTTKLRVVFDASCRTSTGISLNEALMVGPTVQEDLISLLLRYRMPRFVITADIEKMYRQILVREADRPLQRILWREPGEERIRTFQLNTVTYGTSCAPYLATRCLKELANQGQAEFPKAAEVLARDFYMDDMITGVETIDEGRILCDQLRQLLTSAGFILRKWSSNSTELLSNIPTELQNSSDVLNIEPGSSIMALGLKWMPVSDQLGFKVPVWSKNETITKRVALSDAAKLYDPLGLLGPVVVVAKCFLQELWRIEKDWDEPLEAEHQQRWLQFREQLAELATLTIPRRAVISSKRRELHGFSDASQKAYGACIYLRTEAEDGSVDVRLLCAKSKVAPIPNSKRQKNVSLPRLELSGALLLSHLWQKVKRSLNLDCKIVLWVDSTIVLHWIASNPSRWKPFVANRVAEIQHQTYGMTWNYIASESNPADIISRGQMPNQLKNAELWWQGPPWLRLPSQSWPTSTRPSEVAPSGDLEERGIVASVQAIPPNMLFGISSSYYTLVRRVAYLQRFIHNCKPYHREPVRRGWLQTEELNEATLTLVRLAQRESFPEEVRDIQRTGAVKANSKLATLVPVLVDGILRVGGRLEHAPVTYSRKHPIILPSSHPLTLMLAEYYHKKYLHAGQQLLISIIREQFWPLRVRNVVRRVVHGCISCFRTKPTCAQQLMGDLPPERVTPTLPFVNTGVDFCGPLYHRSGSRKAAPVKCFVAVFVCLITKAVHLELVENLSTPAFISTLKRFIARRGKPLIIECDNAKNFRGADRALSELHQLFQKQQFQQTATSYCGSEGISFKFIPPRSPHFGGLWEAAVKSLKRHLKSTIGLAVLRRDDLETLLVQVEACMNSRPLTPLTADPEDLEVLTPGHFLVHRALTAVAEPSYADIPENRLDRYQQLQEYVRRIWRRWNADYLSGLQPRTKWSKIRQNIKEGTLVLVKEDNLPPLKWRYGRVMKVHPGTDGNIRVVDVKTSEGLYRRAVNRICVLPLIPDEDGK